MNSLFTGVFSVMLPQKLRKVQCMLMIGREALEKLLEHFQELSAIQIRLLLISVCHSEMNFLLLGLVCLFQPTGVDFLSLNPNVTGCHIVPSLRFLKLTFIVTKSRMLVLKAQEKDKIAQLVDDRPGNNGNLVENLTRVISIKLG